MGARYHCRDPERLEVTRASSVNGIEYLEVLDSEAPAPFRQRLLLLRLLRPVPEELGANHLRLDGGVRVKARALRAYSLAEVPPSLPERSFLTSGWAGLSGLSQAERERTLVVFADPPGDYSTYRLSLIQPPFGEESPPGFDPRLSAVDFSFKVECPSDFDCQEEAPCPPPAFDEPVIDYLAKDYASFRRLMLDRMAAIAPEWRERSPADLGVALVELMAYVGDRLSYAQDAAATEAYLGTARRRISVRRHCRMVDYFLDEGANARAWVVFEAEAGGPIPLEGPAPEAGRPGALLLTNFPGAAGAVVAEEAGADALRAGAEAFELLHGLTVQPGLERIRFYTWDDQECCLPAGAIAATLRGPLPGLAAGDFLLLEEVLGPRTGETADADPAHRHVVRLTRVEAASDPVHPGVDLVEVAWSAADALPFPLCISGRTDPAHGAELRQDVSVARANVALADHGLTVEEELPPVSKDWPFRPLLEQGPLTHAALLPRGFLTADGPPWTPAAELYPTPPSSPTAAEPAVELRTGTGEAAADAWVPRRDLLGSARFARELVAEIEDDGRARLRFGDGVHGARPAAETELSARYRVGNGPAGNVGAGAIAHVMGVTGIAAVRNPLPAGGGRPPESAEEARRYAPQAFRVQERAVTAADYARAAERHPEVQKAAARFCWTGSWTTVFVTVDRRSGLSVDAEFEKRLRRHLERFRMAGYDLEVEPPRLVPLELALRVCVRPGYLPAHVRRALLDALGSRDLPAGRQGLFHPDAWTFGQPVYLSRIYAVAQAVDGVESVEVTRFRRWGRAARGEREAGVLSIGRYEIAVLDNDPSLPERGRLELSLGGGR